MEQAQQLVDSYFASSVRYWDQVYCEDDLAASIYQRRKEETVKWVSDLGLPPNSRVADIGCGTGRTAIALAQLGLSVSAIDRVPAMLKETAEQAAKAMLAHQVTAVLGDAAKLDFADGSFDVTIALGLLPWVKDRPAVLREMLRVTKPDGHLILSSDNSCRLNYLVDPIENPLLVPFRRWMSGWLRRFKLLPEQPSIPVSMQSVSGFRRFLRSSGLFIVRETTVGFGPFAFFRQELFSDRTGIRVHEFLQGLVDRKIPVLFGTGAHHLVLVRRSSH